MNPRAVEYFDVMIFLAPARGVQNFRGKTKPAMPLRKCTTAAPDLCINMGVVGKERKNINFGSVSANSDLQTNFRR